MWVPSVQFESVFVVPVCTSVCFPNPHSLSKTTKCTISVCEVLLCFSYCVEIENFFRVDAV